MCLALMSFNKEMVMSLNMVPWPEEWTWERWFDIHTATVQKKWLIFQGVAFFKTRIYMSFYVCTLIGEKATRTKRHRICEEKKNIEN